MPISPTLSDLISPEYLKEQRRLHAAPEGYGGRGSKWASIVANLILDRHDGMPLIASVLDYGCGQGSLQRATLAALQGIPVDWKNYDPAVKKWARVPISPPYDVVVCTDCLEHIEPEKIGAVLDHLRSLTGWRLFTVISLVETAKTLSDGRQAHILLESEMWWTHAMASHGFDRTERDFPNPKPEKQFVASWRPI